MDFREYAAKETSALVTRLLTSQAETRLRGVKEALDAATRAIDAALAAPTQAPDDVKEVVQRLNAAATAAAQRIQQDAQKVIDAAREELRQERSRADGLAASLAAAEQTAETLRTDLRRQTDRADAADRDLDATIEAHKQVDAARAEAEAAHGREVDVRKGLEEDLRGIRDLLESSRAEAIRLAGELEGEAAQRALTAADLVAAREEVERLRSAVERAQSAQAETAAARSAVEAELGRVRAERDTIAAARDNFLAERNAVTAERDAIGAARAAIATDRDAIAAHRDALEAERDSIAAQRDTLAVQRTTLASERDDLAAQLAAALGTIESLEARQAVQQETIRSLETRIGEIEGLEAGLRDRAALADAAAASAHDEIARVRAEVGTAGVRGDRIASLLDESVRAMDHLGGASTVSDLLARLTSELAAGFPRVAIFRVKGNHLEGEHQHGLDGAGDITKLVIPRNMDSLITRAAASKQVEQLSGAALADGGTPFGGTPAFALALPIVYQDEMLAIAYADSDREDADAQGAYARLLVRHAVVLLTRLSQELKALLELREYASMLLQEAEQMYTADAEAGQPEKERRRRLKETLECARQLYAQRAALDGTAAAGLLEEQIAVAIHVEPSTPFAEALSAVTGLARQAEDSRRNVS